MGVYVVNGDIALLYQILNENVFQSNVLCPRGVGTIAGDVQCGRVVLSWYKDTLKNPFLKPSCTITFEKNTV